MSDHALQDVRQATADRVEISGSPLSAEQAVRFVTDPHAGGIDVFLGTTRLETAPDGRALLRLDYEAYPEMALRQLRDLAARARQQWPILKLAIFHRTGAVLPGEPSVIIAVSCPHRGEAFAACRWIIDALKAEVAIWKKEVWADGTGTWVKGSDHPPRP